MTRRFLTCGQCMYVIYHPQRFVSAILSIWLCFLQVEYCLEDYLGLFKLYKVMKISFNSYFRNQSLH